MAVYVFPHWRYPTAKRVAISPTFLSEEAASAFLHLYRLLLNRQQITLLFFVCKNHLLFFLYDNNKNFQIECFCVCQTKLFLGPTTWLENVKNKKWKEYRVYKSFDWKTTGKITITEFNNLLFLAKSWCFSTLKKHLFRKNWYLGLEMHSDNARCCVLYWTSLRRSFICVILMFIRTDNYINIMVYLIFTFLWLK